MGDPPPSPPVLTLSSCCPNGVQLSPAGLPHQFTVISDQVANLAVSLNGNNVGNYSGVTSQSFSLLPNSNYNEVIITGTNSNGSSEVVCSFYGTTGVGNNGSYYYYDQNQNYNSHISLENVEQIMEALELGYGAAAAAERLEPFMQGISSLTQAAIGTFSLAIITAWFVVQQGSANDSVNINISEGTLGSFSNDYANNRSGQGTVTINNTSTNISWNFTQS